MTASFDPRDNAIIPSTRWEGEAVPVATSLLDLVATDATNYGLYIVNNTGDSATCGLYVFNAATPTYTVKNAARLQAIGPTGGPTSGRAMRCGVELGNSTAALTAQGRVHVLVTDSRLTIDGAPGGATQAGWTALITAVSTHPECRHFTGSELLTTHMFYSRPRNQADYEDWAGWQGVLNSTQFVSTCLDYNTWTPRAFPMSAIYIVFEPIATSQVYTVTPHVQYMTRWDAGNVMSTTQRISPTTEQKMFDAMAEEAHVYGALGSATTPAPSILKSFTQGAHSHLSSVAAGLGGAAAKALTDAALGRRQRRRQYIVNAGGGFGR